MSAPFAVRLGEDSAYGLVDVRRPKFCSYSFDMSPGAFAFQFVMSTTVESRLTREVMQIWVMNDDNRTHTLGSQLWAPTGHGALMSLDSGAGYSMRFPQAHFANATVRERDHFVMPPGSSLLWYKFNADVVGVVRVRIDYKEYQG